MILTFDAKMQASNNLSCCLAHDNQKCSYLHHVLHDDANNGSNDQDEIKNVPPSREVLKPQADDFHHAF